MTTAPTVDVPSVLASPAAAQPDEAAIMAPDRAPLSFAALYAQMDYVGEVLASWGIRRGDPVAVLLPKGPEMAAALAFLPVSSTVFPLDMALSALDYERFFERCSVKALILPRGQDHNARAAARTAGLFQIDLAADLDLPAGSFELAAAGGANNQRRGGSLDSEIAYIIGSSGTTSERKLIPYTHGQITLFAKERKTWLRLESTDVSLHLVPMYFAQGLKTALMIPLLSGPSVVCPPAYHAARFLALLDEFRPTWFSAGHTVLRDILRHADQYREGEARTRLRFRRSGSGRLEVDEIIGLEKAFNTAVIVNLGCSETSVVSCNPLPPRKRKLDSVGVPTINDVRIRGANGDFVEAGQVGEIVVRGPLLFHGYLDDPLANEQAFVDGWYRIGDLGKFDNDGFLFLRGRIKEVINCGGEKISPAEIDSALESHPSVAMGAAFGIPHKTLGEIVVAAIVPIPGVNADERSIKQHVRSRLSASKMPHKIFVVDELPRTANGKVQRNRLQEAVGQN